MKFNKFGLAVVSFTLLHAVTAFAGTSKWLTKPMSETDCAKVMPLVEQYLSKGYISGVQGYVQRSSYLVARAACYGEQEPDGVVLNNGDRSYFGGDIHNHWFGALVVDTTPKGYRFLVNDGTMNIPFSPFDNE